LRYQSRPKATSTPLWRRLLPQQVVNGLTGKTGLGSDLGNRKAEPHLHNELRFYKMGWYLHFKHVAPMIATPQDRLLVVAASLGTKKTRELFRENVEDVVLQVSPARHRVAFWKADSDPCIQVADYCCWAIQRFWELEDRTYIDLLGSKMMSNKDIYAVGRTYYY
jgi:hypothetical protein